MVTRYIKECYFFKTSQNFQNPHKRFNATVLYPYPLFLARYLLPESHKQLIFICRPISPVLENIRVPQIEATIFCSDVIMEKAYDPFSKPCYFYPSKLHYACKRIIMLSYTTIVVYSRDHKGVGVAHKITSPKKASIFP